MRTIETSKLIEWLCDGVLFLFLAVLIAFGPDVKSLFIPTEIVFVSVFGTRFLLKKSRLTLYSVWGLGLIGLAFLSITYATSSSMAFTRALPVLQVIVFGNLVAPYLRETERKFNAFLLMLIGAVVVLTIRIGLSAPVSDLMRMRLGPTVSINANNLGLSFAFAGLLAFYFAMVERKYWLAVFIPLFALVSLFSGSRKAIAILAVGLVSILFFSRKSLKKAFVSLAIASILVVGIVIVSFAWDPLYAVIGRRIETFFAFFTGGQTDGSTSIRVEMIIYGWKMFLQKPLFGWGLGAFTDVAGFGFYSHNNYIEILVSLGLVGFLWYYALPFCILGKGLVHFMKGNLRKSSVLSLTVVLIFLVDDMGRVRLYSEFSHLLYALAYVGVARRDSKVGVDINQIIHKLGEWVRNPRLVLLHILKWKLCRMLPDKAFVAIKYWVVAKRKLNLSNPVFYNEKIQWLKLYDRKPLYSQLVDKVDVRSYVAERVGSQYLIPQLGVYDSVDQIDWDSLPMQCVFKANHTSGDVLICTDTQTMDREKTKQEISHWLEKNYYWYNREWPYKDVRPRIVCEPYLVDESGYELKDYKIYVFNGVPKLIQVDFDRYSSHKRNIYTTDWHYVDVMFHYPTHPEIQIPKPECLEEMLEFAEALGKDLAHVRVDVYVIQGKIFFGELTLYKGGGFAPFEPMSFEKEMGAWLELPR